MLTILAGCSPTDPPQLVPQTLAEVVQRRGAIALGSSPNGDLVLSLQSRVGASCLTVSGVTATASGSALAVLASGGTTGWSTFDRWECIWPSWKVPVPPASENATEIVLSDSTATLRATWQNVGVPRTISALPPDSGVHWRDTLLFSWSPETDVVVSATVYFVNRDGGYEMLNAGRVNGLVVGGNAGVFDYPLNPYRQGHSEAESGELIFYQGASCDQRWDYQFGVASCPANLSCLGGGCLPKGFPPQRGLGAGSLTILP